MGQAVLTYSTLYRAICRMYSCSHHYCFYVKADAMGADTEGEVTAGGSTDKVCGHRRRRIAQHVVFKNSTG